MGAGLVPKSKSRVRNNRRKKRIKYQKKRAGRHDRLHYLRKERAAEYGLERRDRDFWRLWF